MYNNSFKTERKKQTNSIQYKLTSQKFQTTYQKPLSFSLTAYIYVIFYSIMSPPLFFF